VRACPERSRGAVAALILAGAVACAAAAPALSAVERQAAPGVPSPEALSRLQRDLSAIVDAHELRRVSWGIEIRALDRDEVLFTRDQQKLLLPASNEKVITLATAAERLGWDYTFTTDLSAAGPVDGGVLNGDLIVTGSGDPSLDDWDGRATALWAQWAAELKARGISTVTGRVVGDDNRLQDVVLGSGWAWDDLDRSYSTGVGALQFNQNTARLVVAPGAAVNDLAPTRIEPVGSGLSPKSEVRTTPARGPLALETRRGAGSPILGVRGTIPINSQPVVRLVSVANPTLYYVSALRAALIASGIEVRGSAVDIDDLSDAAALDNRTPLLIHRSPPLSELAMTMMKLSQNLYAETFLAAAGGPPAVREELSRWGIEEGSVVVADGSGLSRYNIATAEAFVAILTHVYRDERLRGPYETSLPIAGRDGTLANRMKRTAAEGNARAKTGAFANARGLAGYVRTADGEPLVFSIMANNFGTTAEVIERAADAIVVKLAEFSRK
jgi:D-alanyl-D-alanine carboxypeptidase/D-alanyl-D-alanine-endopeptidase (penicillin-binding protein 4)